MFSQRNNPYCELLSDYKDTKAEEIVLRISVSISKT